MSATERRHGESRCRGRCGVALALRYSPGAARDEPAPAAGAPVPLLGRHRPRSAWSLVRAAARSVLAVTELPVMAGSKLRASRRCERALPASCSKRLFEEGSDVKAGQAAVHDRRGAVPGECRERACLLARAQANADAGDGATADRYKPLMEANAVSKQEYINAVAAQKTAEADVATAQGFGADCGADQPRLRGGHVADRRPHRPARSSPKARSSAHRRGDAARGRSSRSTPIYVNFTQSTTPTCCGCASAVESGQFKRCWRVDGRRACACCSRTAATTASTGAAAVQRPDGRRDLGPGDAARARCRNPATGCCCPACMCGCGSSRRRPNRASSCRSRR